MINRNIDRIRSAVNFKLADFLIIGFRDLAFIIISMILAWKFSIVFLFMMPFMLLSGFLMVALLKKYTVEELNSYGSAGKIAQEVK